MDTDGPGAKRPRFKSSDSVRESWSIRAQNGSQNQTQNDKLNKGPFVIPVEKKEKGEID